ncbi:MAG: septum formation family protein [Chloroflexota bacterium]
MRGFLGGWGIRLVIIGAIVVGGLIFRDRISGNAAELKVGDCFDTPTTADATVGDVQHHPCTEAHTAEVFFVGDHPAANGAAILNQDDVFGYAMDTCLPALNTYTGTDVAAEGKYDMSAFYPADEDWNKGERGVTCYAILLDGGTMTSSIKAAP